VDNTITTIEMCAGYGGIGLGLKNIFGERMRTLAYCELEGFAQANLISKMEKGLMDVAPLWNDLKTFPYESFHGLVDILIAGYPCQPFSAAGKRAGKEDPRHLWPWIADGIRLLQPRMCFFENVEGHISLGLREVVGELEQMGYKVSWGIFSAREVGAPHQRKRVFILAHLKCAELEGLHKWDASSEQTESIGADSRSSCQRSTWPSRPGEPQHEWEPPRVVGNSSTEGLQRCGTSSEMDDQSRGAEGEGSESTSSIALSSDAHGGEVVGHTILHGYAPTQIGGGTSQSEAKRWLQESQGGSASMANAESKQGTPRDHRGESGSLSQQEQVESGGGDCGALRENNGQAQPALGRDIDGPTSGLDYAELCVSCDNRTDELRLLGNGVVPATAERAFRTLLTDLITK
jgi:DNA (cytosine-5)-methyltransferase 1